MKKKMGNCAKIAVVTGVTVATAIGLSFAAMYKYQQKAKKCKCYLHKESEESCSKCNYGFVDKWGYNWLKLASGVENSL